jgi:hypothetical protein
MDGGCSCDDCILRLRRTRTERARFISDVSSEWFRNPPQNGAALQHMYPKKPQLAAVRACGRRRRRFESRLRESLLLIITAAVVAAAAAADAAAAESAMHRCPFRRLRTIPMTGVGLSSEHQRLVGHAGLSCAPQSNFLTNIM